MAGPGKPGPPARGPEQLEYHRIKVRVLELFDQGLSKAEIARQIGYRNRTQASRMVDRIMQEEMVGAGRDRLRVIHFGRLEAMWASVEAEVIKEDGSPVDERKVAAALKILEREARLSGIDGPGVAEQDEDEPVGRPIPILIRRLSGSGTLCRFRPRSWRRGSGTGRRSRNRSRW